MNVQGRHMADEAGGTAAGNISVIGKTGIVIDLIDAVTDTDTDVVLDADFEILDVICIKLAANGDGDDKLQVKDGSDNAITDDMVTGGLGAAGRIKRAANIIPTYGSLSKGATLRFTQKKNAGNNAVRVVVIGVKS